MSKYEFTGETMNTAGCVLHRIRATTSFRDVKEGDLGGWIESCHNLSQQGTCWVYNEAMVYDNAMVSGDALVYHKARVYDGAQVGGKAQVGGHARVYDGAQVYDTTLVSGDALVFGHAQVSGQAHVGSQAQVSGHAHLYDRAQVSGQAQVGDQAQVYGDALVTDHVRVFERANVCDVYVCGYACIRGDAHISSNFDYTVLKNSWSSGRWITYTRSNRMWNVGCFYGTGEQLIKKAYEDDVRKGKCYEATVRYVEQIEVVLQRGTGR